MMDEQEAHQTTLRPLWCMLRRCSMICGGRHTFCKAFWDFHGFRVEVEALCCVNVLDRLGAEGLLGLRIPGGFRASEHRSSNAIFLLLLRGHGIYLYTKLLGSTEDTLALGATLRSSVLTQVPLWVCVRFAKVLVQ